MRRRSILFQGALLGLVVLTAIPARADLTQKEARKAITSMAGISLKGDSVHVGKIRTIGATIAETTAVVDMVFRLNQNHDGHWRLGEIRTGPERWEDLDLIARAAKFELPTSDCDARDKLSRSAGDLAVSSKRARCLVASLFGVTLPSDAVRIQEVSSLGLPLGSEPSALALARVQIDFRLVKDASRWRVVEFKSGNRAWTNLEAIPAAVEIVKRSRATDELATMVTALNAFRKDRGFFVISDKQEVLIDNLSPKYLARVTRLDPWHRPYQYQGERDHFTIRSVGPDAKPNTGDDLVVSSLTP